jgi:predicted phosphoribosyltransferase
VILIKMETDTAEINSSPIQQEVSISAVMEGDVIPMEEELNNKLSGSKRAILQSPEKKKRARKSTSNSDSKKSRYKKFSVTSKLFEINLLMI